MKYARFGAECMTTSLNHNYAFSFLPTAICSRISRCVLILHVAIPTPKHCLAVAQDPTVS